MKEEDKKDDEGNFEVIDVSRRGRYMQILQIYKVI